MNEPNVIAPENYLTLLDWRRRIADIYGGGVFLPFRDATSGRTTYGGGRYLLDTAKGADLGVRSDELVLDFNFAYHPSCVHDSTWTCPLAPLENRLAAPIDAGERMP